MKEEVILVNNSDEAIGTMEKLEAHKRGLLHRAFSIFIFNSKGELLLQRRAFTKYHSGGLWTNTCCSHPKPGEDLIIAAKRRLQEEMGLEETLNHCFSFIYKTSFDNGLTEHEFDHVFIGYTDLKPNINPEEVAEYKYLSLIDISEDIRKHPNEFTEWFKLAIDKVADYLKKSQK